MAICEEGTEVGFALGFGFAAAENGFAEFVLGKNAGCAVEVSVGDVFDAGR